MFGIDSGELLIIAIVALVVIGPKDLPRVMRTIGQFVGKARGMAKHFRTGIDTMMRESELEEMQKKWQADNERIMRDHPPAPPGEAAWAKPIAPEAPPASRPKAPVSARPKPPPAGIRPVAPQPPAPKAAPPASETP